ncbi:DegV family protein [Paenibacillus sp. FJAT-26967]|uniref:DegV family protein n=1 Tax=Paenibacillus sp. FJAT-26967 TaxID=1729690 RepID=UPI0008383A70|nr:DegV family protein [Paenibacillus sp. FJAT-26967]
MSRVRIVTDSTSDIPAATREKLGIEMVPLKIHLDGETYLDAVTLQPDQFYHKLVAAKSMPSTSQPSPAEFLTLYEKLLAEDPEVQIISIHLSSAMSGTYQSALLAKSMLETDRVEVIDSKSACYGIGALVVAAAEAAREGKSVEECTKIVRSMRETFAIYFLVDTLEFLQKGGRIGKASALIGSLLNIKPILSVDPEGEIASVDKVRGQKKAMARIIDMLHRDVPSGALHVSVAHANNMEAAEELHRLIEQNFTVKSMQYISIGPVIGAHAGPGTVAAFVSPA